MNIIRLIFTPPARIEPDDLPNPRLLIRQAVNA